MKNDYRYFKLNHVYKNKVLIVTISRPPVNAFVLESFQELNSILNYVNNNDEICAMILKSDEKHFSAGVDYKELTTMNPKESVIRYAELRKATSNFHKCSVPIICAVNGAVVGVGAVFTARADVIIASDSAFFSIPEIDVGIAGGGKGIEQLFPPKKVRYMALTGARVSSEEAYKYGGIEAVVPDAELHEKAIEISKVIADKGSLAVRKMKDSLLMTEKLGFDEGHLIEHCLSYELGWLSKE